MPELSPLRAFRRRSLLALAVGLALSASSWAESPVRAATPGWRFPVDGVPLVLRGFDPPPLPWLAGHRGVDLALAAQAPVRAAADGTVTFAGPVAGVDVVVVSQGDLRSTYQPVEAGVEVGQQVDAGDLIGWLDPLTDHCRRTCLHWGVLRGGTYLDPLSFVSTGPPILLPLGPPVSRTITSPRGLTREAVVTAEMRWSALTTQPCLICLGRSP
jgi:murein DD-endopeptidase MepM/ murein hydrolase activator NlpD